MNYSLILLDTDDTLFDYDRAERYLGLLTQGSFLFTGAEEICARLSVSHTLVVVTNGIRDVQLPRIQGSPLHPYIQDIVVSEEVGVSKPDPRIFEHALRKARHDDKNSVLMVGDSLTSDIRGGNNFGIDTCWFNPGNVINTGDIVPTHQIGTLSDLIELV